MPARWPRSTDSRCDWRSVPAREGAALRGKIGRVFDAVGVGAVGTGWVSNLDVDENVMLAVPKVLTIENAMEWIDADELVEVTPDAIRVRKRVLACNIRERRTDAIEDAQGTAG